MNNIVYSFVTVLLSCSGLGPEDDMNDDDPLPPLEEITDSCDSGLEDSTDYSSDCSTCGGKPMNI